MRSVSVVSFVSMAALVLASPAYASGAAVTIPGAVEDQPLGSTRLVSPGWTNPFEWGIESPDTSDGGRITAYIANSAGGASQVFAHRAGAAADVLVSTGPEGGGGDADSGHPRVSPDGRFITYWSYALNIVPDGGPAQIYLYDTVTRTNEIISRNAAGEVGDDDSMEPSVSPDGRFIVFSSYARNLGSNGRSDFELYLYEVASGRVRALNVGIGPGEHGNPVVSAGGRFVAFDADVDGLVPGDKDGSMDVFRYDVRARKIVLVSRGRGAEPLAGAESYDPEISADGSRVCYTSAATNLVPGDPGTDPDIFLTDVTTRSTQLVSRAADGGWANGVSYRCDISGDGQLVSFESDASDLVPLDPNGVYDIFAFDARTGTTGVVVTGMGAQPSNGWSINATLSPDGRYVAFVSDASNLTPDDNDAGADAFVRRIG